MLNFLKDENKICTKFITKLGQPFFGRITYNKKNKHLYTHVYLYV